MAAGLYPYSDGSGWPSTSSWLIRPENPTEAPMAPPLWAIRQMQVGSLRWNLRSSPKACPHLSSYSKESVCGVL